MPPTGGPMGMPGCCVCGPVTLPCCPGRAIPQTLYLHDANGVWPIVFDGVRWSLCYAVPRPGFRRRNVAVDGPGTDLIPTVVDCVVRYHARCYRNAVSGATLWELRVATLQWVDCPNPEIGRLFAYLAGWDCTTRTYGGPFGEEVDPFVEFDVLNGVKVYATPDTVGDTIGTICVVEYPAVCNACTPLVAQFYFPPLLLSGAYPFSQPTLAEIYGRPHGAAGFGVFLTETSGPEIPAAGRICATARRCATEDGPAVPGATVELFYRDETSPEQTGTAGADGRICFDVTRAGNYRLKATDPGGCSGESLAFVGVCGGTESTHPEVIVPVCCVRAAVVVKEYREDGPPVVLPGATVTGLGPVELTSDGSGLALADLAFDWLNTQAVPGIDCTARRLFVTATKDGYLSRCVTKDVACGDDGSVVTEIVLFPLAWPGSVQPRYVRGPGCTDQGCAEPGPLLRGLVPTRVLVQPVAEYQDEGGVWRTLLPSDVAGQAIEMQLDFGLLDDGVSSHESPFGDGAPAIEFYASGTGDWTIDGAGCPVPYTEWRAWLRQGQGLIFEQRGPGWSAMSTCPDVELSPGPLSCATCVDTGQPRRLRLLMPGDPIFCLPADNDQEGTGDAFLPGDSGYRWSYTTTEATEPPM